MSEENVSDVSLKGNASNSNETTFDNSHWETSAQQTLSVLVPTYMDDPTPLISSLASCENIERTEFILFDDGGKAPDKIKAARELAAQQHFPIRIVCSNENLGRSGARNRLLHHARNEWVLMLDADMLPDDPEFLSNYLAEIERHNAPKLVVGGFSLKQASVEKEFSLHRWQAEQSECVPANVRSMEPGRYVFTSNVMAHKDLFEEIPFDESFQGWGWEDVDWGLRIAKAYPIIHLDNTATHLGLDTDEDLMRKYGGSGANFTKAVGKHPEELQSTSLFKAATALSPLPLKPAFKGISKFIISSTFLPTSFRGRALKLWRALVYAEALHD